MLFEIEIPSHIPISDICLDSMPASFSSHMVDEKHVPQCTAIHSVPYSIHQYPHPILVRDFIRVTVPSQSTDVTDVLITYLPQLNAAHYTSSSLPCSTTMQQSAQRRKYNHCNLPQRKFIQQTMNASLKGQLLILARW